MNTAKSLLRVAVLLAIFTAGMCCIFALPTADSPLWVTTFLLSKAAGAACISIFARLHARWSRVDPLVASIAGSSATRQSSNYPANE